MANNKYLNILSVILITILVAFATGCGGGGGSSIPTGPGTDFNPTSVQAPGSTVLANDGAMFSYSSATAANVAVKLPVDNQTAQFALVVTNPNTTAQKVRIKPESYVLGTVRNSVLPGSPDALGRLRLNQAPLESRLRVLANQRAAVDGVRASRSIRASDHSGEKVGDTVVLKVVSDWWGNNYVSRNCKLERMPFGGHCKIFVDQDSYDGLSAVTGTDAVTAADLDHFVTEFETHIYPLITTSYANFYDIDNDGRVSILLSPVYSKLGFAGLFNSNDFADNANSNQRDMIALFSPYSAKSWTGSKWLEATRETICHEMQHLVNYSAHMFFNKVGQEEEWLDESLSVGVEARYRQIRGDPILENRFTLWANSPSSVGLFNFSRALAQYGMVGLYNFFLYEQSDSDTIKALVNSTVLGRDNVAARFPALGMNGTLRNFAMAAMLDTLRNKGMIDLAKIDTAYRYKTPIGLNVAYTTVPFGYSSEAIAVPPYGAAFYLITQTPGFSSTEYQFRIESEEGRSIDVLMVRIPK